MENAKRVIIKHRTKSTQHSALSIQSLSIFVGRKTTMAGVKFATGILFITRRVSLREDVSGLNADC